MALSAFRRILLTNLNVIKVINEETGSDEKILATKIEGSAASDAEAAVPAIGYFAEDVQSAIGHQINFATAYTTTIDPKGDYLPIVVAMVGNLEVNCTITKAPGSLLVKPDVDDADILVAIIPLTAP